MLKSEYIIDEIFNIHNSPEDYEDVDILNFIAEVVEEAKNNSYFSNNLESHLINKRLKLNFCPYCGEALVNKQHKEYHSELAEYGYTPYETINFLYCESCGWNKDNTEE